MENASKALIIAGAILISIVLITLGVLILGQGQEVVNNSNMDDVSIQQFNKKFTQYCGSNVSGNKVKVLLEAIITNNIVADRDGQTAKKIEVVWRFGTQSGAIADSNDIRETLVSKIQTAKVYSVTPGYNDNTGYLNQIQVILK